MLASGAGLVSCITYIWFSALTLALTQLVVEVVTTLLILLGLRWPPMRKAQIQRPRERLRPWGRRGRDLDRRTRGRRHVGPGLVHDDLGPTR